MSDEVETFKVVLNLERRKDGGVRVWSDDVPGLVLSGRDEAEVVKDIQPALEAILSARLHCHVTAHRLEQLPAAVAGVARHPPAAASARPRPAEPRFPALAPFFSFMRSDKLEFAASCG